MVFVFLHIKPEVSPSPHNNVQCACEVWDVRSADNYHATTTTTTTTSSSSRQQSVNYSPGFYPTHTQELPRHRPRAALRHQTWRLIDYWSTLLTVTALAMHHPLAIVLQHGLHNNIPQNKETLPIYSSVAATSLHLSTHIPSLTPAPCCGCGGPPVEEEHGHTRCGAEQPLRGRLVLTSDQQH